MYRQLIVAFVLLLASASAQAQTSVITPNVDNAPVYSNGATMTQGNAATHTPASRILGGPGCTKTTNTNGSNCFVWQALNAGTLGTGDTSSWTCATPANVDNFYATSFPGATTQTDNGVIFACIVKIDYMTLSQLFNDTPDTWTTGAQYYSGAYVRNQGVIYRNDMALTSGSFKCTAGASMPAPPGFGNGTSDGGCTNWVEQAPDIYSSLANVWLHQLYTHGTNAAPEIQYSAPPAIKIWHGGHERPVYLPNQNGEAPTIELWRHFDFVNDVEPQCLGYTTPPCPDSAVIVDISVPPGGSFQDYVPEPLDFLGGNYGVALDSQNYWPPYSNGTWGSQTPYQSDGEPVAQSDSLVFWHRMQLRSRYGTALSMFHGVGPGDGHTNAIRFDQVIIDSGAGAGGAVCDAGCQFSNSLIIDRSLVPGSYGMYTTYESRFFNLTILCQPGVTNSYAIGIHEHLGGGSAYQINNAFFGCAQPYAFDTIFGPPVIGQASNNATDISSGFTGGSFTNAIGDALTSSQMAGTLLNGLTPSLQLGSVPTSLQPPVIVDGVPNGGGGSGTNITTANLLVQTKAQRSVVVAFVGYSNSQPSSSLSGCGLTWSLRKHFAGTGNNVDEYIAYASSVLSCTATVTWPGTVGFGNVTGMAISGAPSSNAPDSNAGLPATNTGAGPAITTTNAVDLLLAYYVCSGGSPTRSGSWQSNPGLNSISLWTNVDATQSGTVPPAPASCGTIQAAIGDAITQIPSAGAIDARVLSTGAAIYGTGLNFNYSGLVPGNDVFGTPRPSRVDIGAELFTGSSVIHGGGGRSWLH